MREEEAIAVVFACISGATAVVAIAKAYIKRLELKDKLSAGHSIAPNVEDRLVRIEQAVDAIAVEVERVAEGQRFATKLFADSLGEPKSLPTPSGRPNVS
jgi:hypothetical protein